jgi:hypothetical protein
MFAALDPASGRLFYRLRDRKRWQEFLGFCQQLRRRFPAVRLSLVCDNYGAHQKAEVLTWCAAHDIELVFTHSNASWLKLDRMRVHRAALLTLDGSDYPSHTAQEAAIAHYIRWANRHATRSNTTRSTPRSADPKTYPTLHDAALGQVQGRESAPACHARRAAGSFQLRSSAGACSSARPLGPCAASACPGQ